MDPENLQLPIFTLGRQKVVCPYDPFPGPYCRRKFSKTGLEMLGNAGRFIKQEIVLMLLIRLGASIHC